MFSNKKVFEQCLHQEDVLVGVIKQGFRNFCLRRRDVNFRRRFPDGQDAVADRACHVISRHAVGGVSCRAVPQDANG